MKNLFSLKDKTVLITGGVGYFGQYFVRGALDYDADKVINIEYPGKGEDFKKALIKKYGARRIGWYEVDLYDRVAAEKCFNTVVKEQKGINVLINNAFDFSPRTGFTMEFSGKPQKVLKEATYEQFLKSFESGAYWAIMATKKFGFMMKKDEGGSIINLCSEYAIRAPQIRLYENSRHSANPPGYSVAKAGLLAFTRYSASWLAPVRVNALIPGAFPNLKEKHKRAGKSYQHDFIQRLKCMTMLNRTGHPSELVGPLIFLASDASSYVTGHGLVIDGGWSMI